MFLNYAKAMALEGAGIVLGVYMLSCAVVVGWELLGLRDGWMLIWGLVVCVPLGTAPMVWAMNRGVRLLQRRS